MTDAKTLDIDVACVRKPRQTGVHERDLVREELRWSLPVDSVALVLIDLWDDIYVQSHLERARKITREKIAPLLEAFRRVGAAVVHAPCPSVAEQYPDFRFGEKPRDEHSPPRSDWPPADFRQKKGEYAKFARPEEPHTQEFDRIIAERRMSKLVSVEKPDVVIADGDELQAFLSHRKILWLFYCGFATNICVLFRDYGMVAMSRQRGYEAILVRDATTGIETADTYEGLQLTHGVIGLTEHILGYTTAAASLLEACA